MRLLFEFDYKDYKKDGTVGRRPSVRGVIVRDGKLAMVYSETYDYYTFPGGGMDKGETMEQTLIREVQEEVGLEVLPDTIEEYGLVVRKEKGMYEDCFIQENYFFLCQVSDRILPQKLDAYEEKERFTLRWVSPEVVTEVNLNHTHGEIEGEKWSHNLMLREAKMIEQLKEDGIVG